MGAPDGNVNALKSGERMNLAERASLPIRTMPAWLRPVYEDGNAYRADLEAAVEERHGRVSVLDAHWINAAVRHEIAAGVACYVLRKHEDKLEPAAVVTITEKMAKATDARNKAVERLNISPATELDVFDRYYAAGPQAVHDPHSK